MLYPVELRARSLRLSPVPASGIRLVIDIYLGLKSGRGREIRTPDILLPKQARYQTALYPDIIATRGHEIVNT